MVDEAALIAALAEIRLGFAALDVFDNEPNVAGGAAGLPNVIVQPHHGSATTETRTAMGQLMIDNISAALRGQAAADAPSADRQGVAFMAQRTKPPFRADHVGSLIRPKELRDARQAYLDGKLTRPICAPRSRTAASAT